MLWPPLLVSLAGAGLIPATLYFSAKPDSKGESVFGNAVLLACAQSVVVLPITFLALHWLLRSQSPEVVSAARAYLFVIPAILVSQYELSLLQGRMHFSTYNALRSVIPVGYVAGVVLLKLLGHLIVWNIVFLHLGLNLAVMFGAMSALRRKGIRTSLRVDLPLLKEMLKFGGKVQVGDVSQGMNLRLDQALMAAWLPAADLGLYVVAVGAASASQVLANAVRIVTTPRMTRKDSVAERTDTLRLVFKKFWVLATLVTLLIGLALPMLIPFIFGSRFSGSVLAAEILLVGNLFVGAKEVLTGGAHALGNPWLASRAELAALAVTFGLLPILLPTLGITGAAIASAASYATVLVLIVYGLNRSYSIAPRALFRFRAEDLRTLLPRTSDGN